MVTATISVIGVADGSAAGSNEYLWLQDSAAASAPSGDTDGNAIAHVYDGKGTQLRSLHLQPDAGTLNAIHGADFDGSGGLWVGDTNGTPALLKIDPSTGAVTQRLQLPSTATRYYAADIAWSGTHMVIDDGASSTSKRLTWIDLSNGSEFRSTTTALPSPTDGKTPSSWLDGVTFVRGGPFVATENTDGSCTVWGLDEITGAVTESTVLTGTTYLPEGMTYDAARHAIVMYRPGGGDRRIVSVNLATGAPLSVWPAPAGFAGSGIALFP